MSALHRVELLLAMRCPCLAQPVCLVVHAHVLVVANVRRGLLVALVVAESHRHLVHVERSVQVVEAVLLEVVV